MSLAVPHLPSPAPTPDNPAIPSQHTQTNGLGSIEEEKKKVRDEVERRLKSLQQDLYELEVCAGAVVPGQEDRIPMYMRRINEQFIALNDLSQRMQPELQHPEGHQGPTVCGDSVPKMVVEQVDTFKNPHQYTKNALSRATGENQYALGRMLGLESFRRQLHDAVGKEMPDVPLPPRRHVPTFEQNRTKAGDASLENGYNNTEEQTSRPIERPIKQETFSSNGAQ